MVEKIECTPSAVVIKARWRPAEAACPACGTWASRVHGSYVRQVRDLPLGGRPVLIHLGMRRFACMNMACAKVTFAGQADGLTARYQRWSVPLAGLLSQVALELAGRAGTRLARALGIAVHRGTLLRLVINLPEPAITSAPEVLGVDDFAEAVQVADRWHLWHNLAEHTAKAVARHRACLKQIAAAADQLQPSPEPAAASPPESPLEARMRDQHAAVQALYARGMGLRAIAREFGIDRKTVRRFAHAATGDEAVARAISRPTVLDRYQPHLHRRWTEGCRDTAALHAEITALGYRRSLRTVYRYLQPLRAGAPPAALTPSALKIGEVTQLAAAPGRACTQ